MKLSEPEAPAFLKAGFFGETGTGKTWTAAKVLSQFIAAHVKGGQLAMYDSETGAPFVSAMVKQITGKPLIAISSRAYSDLIEFCDECAKKGYVALIDSITHPWRSLCNDYLEAKRARVEGAGGRVQTVRLSLQDWGPLKDMWQAFTEKYVFGAFHCALCGREGDVWEEETDEEGQKKQVKTGVKMKTETEQAYEPSLLVQMRLRNAGHYAFVLKDRFGALTGQVSKAEPDLSFFQPHIDLLRLGGKAAKKSDGKRVFEQGQGPNWETIKAQREGVLDEIKDDLLLAWPGRSDEEKGKKVKALRDTFGTSSWTKLEQNAKEFPLDALEAGRKKLSEVIGGMLK